jgi:hypothetical protein
MLLEIIHFPTNQFSVMKIFKILFVLILGSLQVQATGYAHNMFVAQKKLNTKKEVTVEKSADTHLLKSKKEDVKTNKQVTTSINSIDSHWANALSLHTATFDKSAVFSMNEQSEGNSLRISMASKVALFLKKSIYSFLTSFH